MADPKARFLEGNLFVHVVQTSLFASVGLFAIFLVDLVDMYFLSLLGEPQLAAAVGYAGTILFFTTSMGIGFSIAAGALTSRSVGSGDMPEARHYFINTLWLAVIISVLVAIAVYLSMGQLLTWLGAQGKTYDFAMSYLGIVVPTIPLVTIGMVGSGALRAVSDARLAMWITLTAGITNAVLDPLFIFTFGWGLEGAAWATNASRLVLMGVALYGVGYKHQLLQRVSFAKLSRQLKAIVNIAGPAILANVATPIGGAYMMSAMARYGDSAVAGYSVVGRLTPVAFCLVFAVSGAIGPIIGQNLGAKRLDRVEETVWGALKFVVLAVAAASLILWLLQDQLVKAFSLGGDGGAILTLFCSWIAITFVFKGMLFISNATFNNLGYARYATYFNFGKATIGTIPFVMLGTALWGSAGVLIGEAMGAVCFGLAALWTVQHIIGKCDNAEPATEAEAPLSAAGSQHLGSSSTAVAGMAQSGIQPLVNQQNGSVTQD